MRVVSRVKICVDNKCKEVDALFDTGSTYSYVSKEVADELGYKSYSEEVYLATEDAKVDIIGIVSDAKVFVDGCKLPWVHDFGVIDGLKYDAIIGLDIIELCDIVLDLKKGRAYPRECPPKIILI